MNTKDHWENIYGKKKLEETSWFQSRPTVSIEFMKLLGVKQTDQIIDVGGGDSLFVDYLLQQGFSNITVLDISANAIARAKKRTGNDPRVHWIVTDITKFEPETKYDFWHDRAVLHFLTNDQDVRTYLSICNAAMDENGKLVMATFSENGPDKCSGLDVRKYSEETMSSLFSVNFIKVKCMKEIHSTPQSKVQEFLYCAFNKKA